MSFRFYKNRFWIKKNEDILTHILKMDENWSLLVKKLSYFQVSRYFAKSWFSCAFFKTESHIYWLYEYKSTKFVIDKQKLIRYLFILLN